MNELPDRSIVVAGAGLAGLRASVQLRAAGWTGSLVVIGDEPHLPYNRPPLTKEALVDGVDDAVLRFAVPDAVAGIEFRLGTRVESCNRARRTLTLATANGRRETIQYEGLVVATGVRPRRLPWSAALSRRHTVRTLDDASALRRQLMVGSSVVVIGGGFIGCEVAASARALGCHVTVIEPFATPLYRALGSMVGAELQRRHEARGVVFEVGRTVVSVQMVGEAATVVLDSGLSLKADVVVEAVGSVPNVEWLDGQGFDLIDGIRCDANLHPLGPDGPVENIVALGDVARFPIALFGEEPVRIEHWNMPGDTAAHAARSLLDGMRGGHTDASVFTPLPSFWTDQYGDRFQFFGMPTLGSDDARVLEGDLRGECVIGYHRNGTLVGFALLGKRGRMMHYRTKLLDDLRLAAAEGASR